MTNQERCAKWAKENPDRFRANRKAYYVAHRTEACQAAKLWRKQNVKRNRQNSAAWKCAHPDQVQAMAAKRRALKFGAAGEFTAEQFGALGKICLCCGRDDVSMTADHVIPLSKGGSNDIGNIQPLCGSCNSTKHDKDTDYRKVKAYGASN